MLTAIIATYVAGMFVFGVYVGVKRVNAERSTHSGNDWDKSDWATLGVFGSWAWPVVFPALLTQNIARKIAKRSEISAQKKNIDVLQRRIDVLEEELKFEKNRRETFNYRSE